MIRERITIINKAGLHARAASKLAAVCSRYACDIRIGDEHMVDGKSILSLMMLAANKGTELDVIAEGDDENNAVEEIIQLVNNRFDEAE
ncbi:MAG: HPr family phosphocarrier protein [Pseudohongiellaceae bacterium]